MNIAIVLARNNIHLTRKAVESLNKQDIETSVLVVNNASEDMTAQWLASQKSNVLTIHWPERVSVAEAWNGALQTVFSRRGLNQEYCLVCNNDMEVRPETYRVLLEDGGGFITAVGNNKRDEVFGEVQINPLSKRPHPDFSCYLIRRWVYEKVGPFDENFKIAFGEDWDYHVRMHRAGVRAECLDIPYFHHGSMTIKTAELTEVRNIQVQADKNREYFKRKWGFAGASEEYYKFFEPKPEPPPASSTYLIDTEPGLT